MSDDPRLAAARYQVDKAAQADGAAKPDEAAQSGPDAPEGETKRKPDAAPTRQQRAAIVENAIQQAMRRGDFDNLPGAGKPLPGLGGTYDPDWWIRRKIETEQLQGLGPPALTLRVEATELEARLDALFREADVRAALEEFNRRVIEARRQLLGGPPVTTAPRDVDTELAAWRERRETRRIEEQARNEREMSRRSRRRWRGRWRRNG